MPSVYIKTLGCKVNTFDSHALSSQFQAKGYQLLSTADGADITVVNSCTVTERAASEARAFARKVRRSNPDSLVVVTGCYAQTDSARLAAMPEVDFVVPNSKKAELVALVTSRQGSGDSRPGNGTIPETTAAEKDDVTPEEEALRRKLPASVLPVRDNRQSHFTTTETFFAPVASSQTRTFLKIQDGCNGFCTYCIIPYARGSSRSVPHERIVAEVRRQVALGVREIVLTGIHVGDYGRDQENEISFADLVREVFAIPGLGRLRISSLEPSEVTPALLAVLAEQRDRFCDHFHLPLQSGSDAILKKMRRTYSRAEYRDIVQETRRLFPQAHFSADVIPGFPGESASDFAATVSLIHECDLNGLHVFPYSRRPNTAALRLPDHVQDAVIHSRAAELRELAHVRKQRFALSFVGKKHLSVLWESDKDAQGRRLGYTRNYLRVVAHAAEPPCPGSESTVEALGLTASGFLLVREGTSNAEALAPGQPARSAELSPNLRHAAPPRSFELSPRTDHGGAE